MDTYSHEDDIARESRATVAVIIKCAHFNTLCANGLSFVEASEVAFGR